MAERTFTFEEQRAFDRSYEQQTGKTLPGSRSKQFSPEENAAFDRAYAEQTAGRDGALQYEEAIGSRIEGGDSGEKGWSASWSVSIDGRDISSRLNPHLESIEVTDKDGTSSDTCRLVLDDSEAKIKLPRAGGLIAVTLERVEVFRGTIDEIQSTGTRGQGRIITLSAKGFDSRGKVKAPLDFHRDNTSLQTFLDDAARRAGLATVTVDPAFGSIVRDYWSADGESFVHLCERLAREFGGTFKVKADRAVLARRGEGLTPSGKPMPSLTGTFGDNLISWDISPFVGRPRGTKARVKFYDRKTARYETREVEIEPTQYSAGDKEKIEAAFADTGKSPREFTPQEMAVIRQAYDAAGNPIGTVTDAVKATVRSAFDELTAEPRTYSPEEMTAIRAAFDAPNETMTRAYSEQEMAAIRKAFDEPDTVISPTYSAANGEAAETTAKGKKSDSQRKSGEGSVQLILTPQARVEGTFVIKGARPGIDGSYRIGGVTHRLDRSGGSTTELELKQPGKGTGSDTRSSGAWSEERARAHLELQGSRATGPGGGGQG